MTRVLANPVSLPAPAAMFERLARNLVPAHALGMTTVWLTTGRHGRARGRISGRNRRAYRPRDRQSSSVPPSDQDLTMTPNSPASSRKPGRARRANLRPHTGAVRDAVETRSTRSTQGNGASPRKWRRMACASMAEESRAAVVPAERHEPHRRRAGRRALVGQGRFQIRRLERSPFSRGGISRGARRDCAPLRLYRAKAWC